MQVQFMEEFGVNIRNEDDLYQFKYNQLVAKWTPHETWECRGSILRRTNGTWKFVARPFDKFFNQHEGHSGVHEKAVFDANVHNYFLNEKADGTCIQVWWDDVKNTYRSSTLGTITPFLVGDYEFTFDDLFWKTLGENSKDMITFAKDKTFILELCCTANRIVTKYPEDKIFLLAVRDNESGEYTSRVDSESIVADHIGLNLHLPYFDSLVSLGINSLEELLLFVNKSTSNKELFGEYPEGFVVYDDSKPVCKIKNEAYLAMHNVSGGDTAHTRNVVIDCFFTNTLDDIYDHLIEPMQEYAEGLKDKVVALFEQIQTVMTEIENSEFETQKDYAMKVQAIAPKNFYGFFFQKKNEILDSEKPNMEIFTDWLTLNYKKFEDYWKDRETPD